VSDYLSQTDAEARLGISRTLFEERFRPQLTVYPFGPRAVRFSWSEIEQLVAESAASQQEEDAPMFFRRTVQEALDHTWKVRWSKAKGSHKKQQLMRVVGRDVGGKRLDTFGYNELEEWVTRLFESGQAVETVKSKVSCVMTALKTVQPKGWIKTIPLVPPLGSSDNAKLRWLTDEEQDRLVAACESQRRAVIAEVMRDAILFMVDTGARVGELLKVREDSLFERGRVTCVEFLDRKGADDLRVPLTKRAHEAILRLIANRYWQNRIRGVRENQRRHASAQSWVTHRFEEIRNAAKLSDVTAHTLRHTCASRLVQRGVNLYVVQKWLGHDDIRQTERYAHLAPNQLDDSVQVLEPPPANVSKLDDYRKS
jgi:integrase